MARRAATTSAWPLGNGRPIRYRPNLFLYSLCRSAESALTYLFQMRICLVTCSKGTFRVSVGRSLAETLV